MRTSFNTVLFCVILAGLVSCKDGMDNGSNILSFTAERTDFSAPPTKTHLVDFSKSTGTQVTRWLSMPTEEAQYCTPHNRMGHPQQ